MITHIHDQADLFTVLSRLAASYVKLTALLALPSNLVLARSGKAMALVSAFGSSCE